MGSPLVTAKCRFEMAPEGFVRATVHAGAEMDIDDAKESLAAVLQVAGGRAPVLVDMRAIKAISMDARDHFGSDASGVACSAIAVLIGSPVSRVIGNFFLRRKIPETPNRLFTDESAAITWLLAQGR